MILLNFLVPHPNDNPIIYKEKKKECCQLCLQCQLFFVLCRLRNGFDLKDVSFRFGLISQTGSALFNSWIKYMYLRLGSLSLWPDRQTLIRNMTAEYRKDFPTTLAIIDCTELKTERPSSLKAQSQCYSDYKSGTTIKALVVTDSRGSFMFTSTLFSGSISDKDICERGHFYQLLRDLLETGKIQPGDGIMSDKGFLIEKELNDLGPKLNIPPFSSAAHQMAPTDVALTRKIAKHRIHVERAIKKIRDFKLVGRRIPISLFGSINEIWFVCCSLTLFQSMLVKK